MLTKVRPTGGPTSNDNRTLTPMGILRVASLEVQVPAQPFIEAIDDKGSCGGKAPLRVSPASGKASHRFEPYMRRSPASAQFDLAEQLDAMRVSRPRFRHLPIPHHEAAELEELAQLFISGQPSDGERPAVVQIAAPRPALDEVPEEHLNLDGTGRFDVDRFRSSFCDTTGDFGGLIKPRKVHPKTVAICHSTEALSASSRQPGPIRRDRGAFANKLTSRSVDATIYKNRSSSRTEWVMRGGQWVRTA